MKLFILSTLIIITLNSCEEALVGSEKLLYARAQTFESNPIEARLRDLLRSRTDGAMSYLKMALVGEAFGKHPDQFKKIANELNSKAEQESFLWLREHGVGVFEYYPNRKPKNFEAVYEKATWLKTIKLDKSL